MIMEMRNRTRLDHSVVRLGVAISIVVSFFSFASYSQEGAFKVSFVEATGASAGKNNVVFAHGRYALIAPYAPSKVVEENGDLDQLDNHYLYVIDTKKPGVLFTKDLTAFEGTQRARTIYYPTKVRFDTYSQNVFIRGTRFEKNDAGEIQGIEVIAYVRLNLGDNGKPVVDQPVVSFDIRGIAGEKCTSDAPFDIGLGREGRLLTFTNGASVFTYNVDLGYLFQADIIDASQYGPDNNITLLSVDSSTNVLTVCANRRVTDKLKSGEEVSRLESTISFYRLEETGLLSLLRRISPADLPGLSPLNPGSDVVILSDPENPGFEAALFVTSDGSLCRVELSGESTTQAVKQLAVFDALAQADADGPSPSLLKYDSDRRVVGIVRQGYGADIARPANGRRGIARPANAHILSGRPILVMAKLSKKGKVQSSNIFSEPFVDQGGLTDLVSWQNEDEWLFATYSGRLFSIPNTGNFEEVSPRMLGEIGSRLDRLNYLANRESVVAVQSCVTNESGLGVSEPGSLVVAKSVKSEVTASLLNAAQSIMASGSTVAARVPAIRRPCNTRR